MEGKFDASTPNKITEFAKDVLKEFEVDIISKWDGKYILTTIKNPITNGTEQIRSYPAAECDVRASAYVISCAGVVLKLQKKQKGLHLL